MTGALQHVRDDRAALETLARALHERGLDGAQVALVLGSGLGPFAERVEDARVVSYDELDGMPCSAVPGHAGRLVRGRLRGVEVLVQQGRVHLYEGWSTLEVTRAVRAIAQTGIASIVLTNAAGGLVPDWEPGTLMRVVDQVDLQQRPQPLVAGLGGTSPYDAALGAALDATAAELGQRLERGVYAGLLGPSYETPAEVRMLRELVGAQAVGMSTVAEARVARACGLRVGAISCITNQAAGISPVPLAHDEVVATGRRVADAFAALLEQALPAIAALR